MVDNTLIPGNTVFPTTLSLFRRDMADKKHRRHGALVVLGLVHPRRIHHLDRQHGRESIRPRMLLSRR